VSRFHGTVAFSLFDIPHHHRFNASFRVLFELYYYRGRRSLALSSAATGPEPPEM